MGWWKDSAGAPDREYLSAYLGSDGADIAWDFIRASFASVSRTTIVMMQVGAGHFRRCEHRNQPHQKCHQEGQCISAHLQEGGPLRRCAC